MQTQNMIDVLPNLQMPLRTDISGMCPVMEIIARTTHARLEQEGCFSNDDAISLLDDYVEKLGDHSGAMPDFLNFAAERSAQKNSSLTVDGELARMQKLLRKSLNGSVYQWSFGPLVGRSSTICQQHPRLRAACMVLGSPFTEAGEKSIVHVAALNPVSALVASTWITQELSSSSDGEKPFVFTFFTDLAAWQMLMQRHFAS